MKSILLSLFLFSPLFGAPHDEIIVIEQLIETTQKNLNAQQTLLKLLLEFDQAKGVYITDPDNGKLATALVKRAMRLHKHLEKERLHHLFPSDFLVELAFFNQVGKNQIVQKP